MEPLILELPLADAIGNDPDDDVHIVCCDDDTALCGARPTGDYENDDFPEELICEVCVNRDRLGLTCGTRFCRLRQWWRDRRPGGAS